MEIPKKYRGETYVKIATDFTIPIDSGYATALGNKPRYICRVFFDLEDLKKNVMEWIEGTRHLGGSRESIVSFNEVNDDFLNLIHQTVTELNRGNLDISQLEEYILKQ